MSDQEHTEVNGLESYGLGDKLDVSESAQLPKDNQIDIHAKLVEIILGKNGDAYSKSELILTALATAIREATPGQLTEFHGQGTMQLEATVHQAAIDQFLAKLKDIGLVV